MSVIFLTFSLVILCGIVLLLAKVYVQFDTKVFRSKLHTNLVSFVQGKVDCDRVKTKCSQDSDCQTACYFGLSCVQGTCQSKYETTQKCDVKKGLVSTYEYLPAIGTFESICLSVDPGVALENGQNVYCQGGSSNLDYTSGYPNVCSCPTGETALPIWGNLNRRLTHGCTKSKIFQNVYYERTVKDHV